MNQIDFLSVQEVFKAIYKMFGPSIELGVESHFIKFLLM